MAGGFDQEGAAPSRTDQCIDFLEQVLRQENVGSFDIHMCITSVPYIWAFVNTLPRDAIRSR